jgi:hypothetical protein
LKWNNVKSNEKFKKINVNEEKIYKFDIYENKKNERSGMIWEY